MPAANPSGTAAEPQACRDRDGDGSQQNAFLKSVFAEITGRQPPRRPPHPAVNSRLNTD